MITTATTTRTRAAAAKVLQRFARCIVSVREWLCSSHNFAPCPADESERVALTGWQYVLLILALCAFALAASINWDAVL